MKKRIVELLCICMVMALLAGCSGSTGQDKEGRSSSKEEKKAEKQDETGVVEGVYDEDLDCILADGLCYEIKEDTHVAVIGYHDEEKESIIIPELISYEDKEYPVKEIGENAFSYQQVLREVSLPDSLEMIGKEAFCGCSTLESIIIPDAVTYLGSGIFYDCSELRTCTIGAGVSTLSNEIFTNCYALEEVQLPDKLVAIGEEVFWACENLKEMVLPVNVVSIGQRAFYGSGLQQLTIPSPSINITEEMLEGMDELETLSVQEGLVDAFEKGVNMDVHIEAIEG